MIFYIFLFSIPFQTRKILWYEGWRFNEWQAVSVYFTDLLLAALFLLWISNTVFSLTPKLKITVQNLKISDYFLFTFIAISAVSIKNSSNFIVSWFQLIKLIEFVIFYFYLKNYAFQRFNLIQSAWVVVSGGVFQAVIGISQFLKQSSLGLWYFGESVVSVDLRGTAYFLNMAGEKIIRVYGTTPHPNVLAGYLLFVLFILYFTYVSKKDFSKYYFLFPISYFLILFSFLLTFSRVVILAWAIAFIAGILIYRKSYPEEVKKIFISTCIVAGIFTALFWPEILSRLIIASDDEGLLVREQYIENIMRSDLIIFGVGIGNFVGWFADKNPMEANWLYQPVHNIYLLIYSETGLLGISAFFLFLSFLIKKSYLNNEKLFTFYFLLFTFLFIDFFDHFLWTLQQGRLVFWGVLTFLSLGDIMES